MKKSSRLRSKKPNRDVNVNRGGDVMAAMIEGIAPSVASGITVNRVVTGVRVAINLSVLNRVIVRHVRNGLRPNRRVNRVNHESRVKPARSGRNVPIAGNVVSDRNARVANVNRQRKPSQP